MVDGFPLAQKGQAYVNCRSDNKHCEWFTMGNSYLCTITLVHKPVNDLGYTRTMGIYLLALATVGFVSSTWWVRSLIAIAVGIGLGLIGTDPATNADRYTLGWDYLGDGIQLMPLLRDYLLFQNL